MRRVALRRALAVSVVLWSSLWPAVPAGAQLPAPALTVPEYIAWLDTTESAVRDEGLARTSEIPPLWRIETSSGPLAVSNAWLIRDLRRLETKPDRDLRARVGDRLGILRAEAVAFQIPPPDVSARRARLLEILDRREFRGIHGPTWRDRLRQRILQFILDVMGRLFGTSIIPTVSNIVVYVLIGIAVLVLAIWTFRSIRRTSRLETVVPDRLPVSATAWSVWLAEAQSAAGRGAWRDAVHRSYWCAVSFLEGRGSWRPDRARTPREYLRLLPASSEHRPTLAALTQTFELVWYGTDEADARAYADALANLERLGCRPV